MNLKPSVIQELQEIVQKDYSVVLSNTEANDFGASLLRLTRLASVALARVDDRESSVQARGRHPLEAKTNVQECTSLKALGEPMRGLQK